MPTVQPITNPYCAYKKPIGDEYRVAFRQVIDGSIKYRTVDLTTKENADLIAKMFNANLAKGK